jgi:adenine deaminase
MKLYANFVDIYRKNIYPAKITITNDKIASIEKTDKECSTYILPGFIDAHIHIESSMLIPTQFAKLATRHGTVATVSDPHEIANVLGVAGIEYMIDNAKKSDLKIYFGASPCVPATPFETNGATLNAQTIEKLLARNDIYYLSEVMNFPGVINDDKDMLAKINSAKRHNKPIDGHAPALRGENLQKYIDAGVQTDHEAFSYDEAVEKIEKGMKIEIREGSAAKNYKALHPLIDKEYENLMFCSDDKHPNDLKKGHINELVKHAIEDGHELFKVLQIACINPIKHYKLDVGRLKIGDDADFIEVKNLQDFEIIKTVIKGEVVFQKGLAQKKITDKEQPNNFVIQQKTVEDYEMHQKCSNYNIIHAINGELITTPLKQQLQTKEHKVIADIQRDILFISVTNRYKDTKPTLALVNGFGLCEGAIASSVAHDSHNIIAVGCDAKSITKVVNAIIETKGGIAAVNKAGKLHHLPLPVAGLMSNEDGEYIANLYEKLESFTKKELKSTLESPFMTLSFMALLVIPEIKISDKGLFDSNAFHFIKECKQ